MQLPPVIPVPGVAVIVAVPALSLAVRIIVARPFESVVAVKGEVTICP